MFNHSVVAGRLTKEVELRHMPNQAAVASFTLAVQRPFKNHKGEYETDFINCVIWGKQAENLHSLAKKGSMIGISGHIQTRSYESSQGYRVYVTEVVAEHFRLLGGQKGLGMQPPLPQEVGQSSFFEGHTTTIADEFDVNELPN